MMDTCHVLIIEDDTQIRLMLSRYFLSEGFRVTTAGDAREAMRCVEASQPNILLLDVMLPGGSGLELCRALRSRLQVPIIMLTALGDEVDRVAGLEVGADDYVTKPFSLRELLARVRAVLRRSRHEEALNRGTKVYFDGWRFETRKRELISPDGTFVDLSTSEYDMLCMFAQNSHMPLSRRSLAEALKGRQNAAVDRVIDVQVSRLRKKLHDEEQILIRSIRNVGYVFSPKLLKRT